MLQYFTRTWNTMKIYYTTVYRDIMVGVVLTGYVYFKLSYGASSAWKHFLRNGGGAYGCLAYLARKYLVMPAMKVPYKCLLSLSGDIVKKQWQTNPLLLAIIKWLFVEYAIHDLTSPL